ncbi:MAG: CDP-glucose 4,6-dehydratase [Pseudomonadota bacterium]
MVNPDSEFWQGKKVLLTGHTGFKGSWLSCWLTRLGAQVTGYALEAPSDPSLFELLNLSDDMQSIYGDVRDLGHLRRVVTEGGFDLIIHMAAQSLVRESYESPVDTYATNVMGTVHLLQVARESEDVRVVINVTSDKCYENTESRVAFKESDAMGGFDPYSNSKGCAELVTAAFRQSFLSEDKYHSHGTGIASVRAGNVIGGGDWAKDRLIPDIMRGFLNNERVLIRNPHAIRPWQHVLEPLSGYLLLAENIWKHGSEFASGWNFGPLESDARPVSWIVEQLAKAWGEDAHWEIDGANHPHEASYLKLNVEKAQKALGYQPRLNLSDCLEWVSNWYRAYGEEDDLKGVTLGQIDRFERHGL